MTAKTGVISTQVLAEFFVTVTRKIQLPLSPAQAMSGLGTTCALDCNRSKRMGSIRGSAGSARLSV